MTRRAAVPILLVLCTCGAALAVERFPLPDFPAGYKLPATTTPPPRAAWQEWLDVGVLVASLAAATLLALRFRWRRGLVLLGVFSIGYFGFYRHGCVCPVGSVQDVADAIARGTALPVVVLLFFLVPLAATLLFGRTFCAGVCPLGAIQDVVLFWPLKVPAWLEHVLGLGPWVYLGVAVLLAAGGSGYLICRYDPFVGFFRLSGPVNILLFGAMVLLAGMFVGRPYCRFLCPYGAVLRPLSRLAWRHATITPAGCINCRLCEEACPFGAIRRPTPPAGTAPPTRGKGTLALVLAALPVLTLGGAWAVGQAGGLLSKGHFTVRLAREAELAEYLLGAEKLSAARTVRAGGTTFALTEANGQAVVRASAGPGRPAIWQSPPLASASRLASPTGRAGLALSADGNTVWTLLKDRQVLDGNMLDVYELAFLDAGTGALQRREERRLDVNLVQAFTNLGVSAAEVGACAREVESRFAWGAYALGAFLGLVMGLKLVQLSVRRTRGEYDIDRSRCVSCGRCFRYCPVRRGVDLQLAGEVRP